MICQQTFLPKQTVNAIVTGYWRQGVVELAEMKSDRRNKEITLTASGKAYAEKIIPQVYTAEIEAMAKLDETQRTALLTTTKLYLEHFRECIQNIAKGS
jgi:Transcriptional regulators